MAAPTPVTPDRQQFRALVADVAARAKARLPEAVNGRVESAVKLVLAHDVTFLDDGTIEVGSSSDPLKTYTLAGHACDCQDFAYGKAPDGWCQHRIAAGIAKRVGEVLAARETQAEADQVYNCKLEASGDVTADSAVIHTPASLPEAPASVNCHITIAGRQVQLTLRDTDESRLLERLQTVLERYPLQQAASPPQDRGKEWCSIHNVAMQRHENAKGVWYSHYIDGAHCKGKRGRS